MGTLDKNNKDLVQYNVQNAVYVLADDTAGTVKPLTFMNTFSKDRNVKVKDFYGDGEVQDSAYSDLTISGAVGVTARDMDFEKDIGLVETLKDGLSAELAVTGTKRVHLGLETFIKKKGQAAQVKRVWIFNLQILPPSESLTQTKEDITESAFDYSYVGYGTNVKSADGQSDYVDENGMRKKAFTVSARPDDAGYKTFFEKVPVPTVATATTTTTTTTE